MKYFFRDILIKLVLGLVCVLAIVLFVTRCSGIGIPKETKERLEKKAIEYFTQKYNIDKSEIHVVGNYLYDMKSNCINTCSDGVHGNTLEITYNDKTYTIKYNMSENTFTDDYTEEVEE